MLVRRVGVAALALQLAGCSVVLMDRPKASDMQVPACDDSVVFPALDAGVTVASAAGLVYYASRPVDDTEPKTGFAGPGVLLVALALVAVPVATGISSIIGFSAARRCRAIRRTVAPH